MSRIPGEYLGIPFRHVQVRTGCNHRNKAFCTLFQGFQQLPLGFRNQQVDLVSAEVFIAGIPFFTFQSGIQPDACDRDVSSFRIHGSFRQPVIRLGEIGCSVFEKVASEAVKNTDPMLCCIGAKSAEERDIAAAGSVVVAFQRHDAVRVGTDYRDRPDLLRVQRKRTVVLQQHHALFCGLQRKAIMIIRIRIRYRDPVVLTVVCKHTEQEARGEKAFTGQCDLILGHQTFLDRFHHMQVRISAVQIAAVFDRERGAFRRCRRYLMVLMEITDRPAVTDDMPLESPFLPQRLFQQRLASAGRFSVYTVVCAHNRFDFCFPDGYFKRRKVGLVHILCVCFSVKVMAHRFRTGMYGKMLTAGSNLQVFSAALESFDEADSEP